NFDYQAGLAFAHAKLGQRQMWWGSSDGKAEASLREADNRLSKLLEQRPADRDCRAAQAGALINLGMVCHWRGGADDALNASRRATQIAEVLVEDFPQDVAILSTYAQSLGNLAGSLGDAK